MGAIVIGPGYRRITNRFLEGLFLIHQVGRRCLFRSDHFVAGTLVRLSSGPEARRREAVDCTSDDTAFPAVPARRRARKSLLLMAICRSRVVGNRPDRYEPRLLKRRTKPYELMQKPRSDYKPGKS